MFISISIECPIPNQGEIGDSVTKRTQKSADVVHALVCDEMLSTGAVEKVLP